MKQIKVPVEVYDKLNERAKANGLSLEQYVASLIRLCVQEKT